MGSFLHSCTVRITSMRVHALLLLCSEAWHTAPLQAACIARERIFCLCWLPNRLLSLLGFARSLRLPRDHCDTHTYAILCRRPQCGVNPCSQHPAASSGQYPRTWHFTTCTFNCSQGRTHADTNHAIRMKRVGDERCMRVCSAFEAPLMAPLYCVATYPFLIT